MTTETNSNTLDVTSSPIMAGVVPEEDVVLIESCKDSLHDVEEDDGNNKNNIDDTLEDSVGVNRDLRSLLGSRPSRGDGLVSGRAAALVSRGQNFRNLTKIGAIEIQDHFSLQNPSSHISFADDEAIVFVDNLEQITLEKKKDHDFYTAKQATVGSPGILLLRGAYTAFAFMLACFILAFCIHIILLLFLSLAIESGLTSNKSTNVYAMISIILSIPVFATGLSYIMVIANCFVIDVWKGSHFMHTITKWDSVTVDWISFLCFFGWPIIISSISLFTGTKDWWIITSISWFSLVMLYFIVFAVTAIYHECDGCLELVKFHPKLRDYSNPDYSHEKTLETFYRALKLRLKQQISGYESISYIANSNDPHPDNLSYVDIKAKESANVFIGPFSRLTKLEMFNRLYTKLETPLRQYNVDDVVEFTPYVTNSSWGLESIYCRNRRARYMAIIDGESALTKSQVRSSLVCYFVGISLTVLFISGASVWYGLSPLLIIFVLLVYIASIYKNVRSSLGLSSAYRTILRGDNGRFRSVKRNRRSNALYQVHECFRISEPRQELYWVALIVNCVLFIIIPTVGLFQAKNPRVGCVFIFLSLLSILRDICNAPACLRELGSLEGIEVNNKDKSARAEWREKHRLAKILNEISGGKRTNFWISVFSVFVFAFFLVSVIAIFTGVNDGKTDSWKFASEDDFVYEGSSSLTYASCALTHHIQSPGGHRHSLADFAFLSAVAYLEDEFADEAMSHWFNDTFTNDRKTINQFQETYKEDSLPVSYKLFEFPSNKVKIISIRGTSNAWDALADVQLWLGAALFQNVRSFVPLGELFSPVLPHLVKAVSVIEDVALENVSYYKQITSFVEQMKEREDGNQLIIVGHSLGGGIAMISGAQTQVPSVAFSGPNSIISKRTFEPPITKEALDEFTFNVVPDRDLVPRIDDLAENYQRIKCRAAPNKFLNCHHAKRSLCEILFTCGSEGRPIPCYCVDTYGFDPPAGKNGANFADVCV